MKILIIHNYYQIRGGEDAVFENEKRFLSQQADVDSFTLHNRGGFQGAMQFIFSIWNVFQGRRLRNKIAAFKPDCIHIHNLHFAIGYIAIRVAKKAGVPIVMTLHNYRLLCPSGTLAHDGKLFTNSLASRFPWVAVRKKVYRDSFVQSFWLAFTTYIHEKAGTFRMIDKYVALTDFSRDLYVDSHIHILSEKVVVKPNFVEVPVADALTRDNSFLYVGRLSVEKGIQTLLDTFSDDNHKLYIIGDGPMKSVVESTAAANDNISYLGFMNKDALAQHLRRCTALIFPSIWYEGLPMTILESFAAGLPVIASNIGSMKNLVTDKVNGLHFEPGNAADLTEKVCYWSQLSAESRQAYSHNAMATYQNNYLPENNINQLIKIYKQVTSHA